MAYRTGIVGATGVVGQELITLLLDRGFPLETLRCFASARSKGKSLKVGEQSFVVEETRPDIFKDLDLAFFAVDGDPARKLAPIAKRHGCVVIDNSSAFRQDSEVPLVIPEINPGAAHAHRGLIANPNCSIAITLMGLYPLHRAFGVRRVFCCTYQAVSGAGLEAMQELEEQVHAWADGRDLPEPVAFPNHSIAFNLIPHVDRFSPDGYTGEEIKMRNEARKILDFPELHFSATCVRVPVFRAHSIAVHAEFDKAVNLATARQAIEIFEGAILCDEPDRRVYPTPLQFTREIRCGVGRLRKDSAMENGLAFFVSGDQLWKGAALNAVQIAESLDAAGCLSMPETGPSSGMGKKMKKAGVKKKASTKKSAAKKKNASKKKTSAKKQAAGKTGASRKPSP